VRIAYLDESGTPDLTGGTSHFVLLALSMSATALRKGVANSLTKS
jgi:hypothetical protein